MTRGEISRQTEISARTIRFYEEKGIIPIPERTANGYRNYDSSMIPRLKFIKNAQRLDFCPLSKRLHLVPCISTLASVRGSPRR